MKQKKLVKPILALLAISICLMILLTLIQWHTCSRNFLQSITPIACEKVEGLYLHAETTGPSDWVKYLDGRGEIVNLAPASNDRPFLALRVLNGQCNHDKHADLTNAQNDFIFGSHDPAVQQTIHFRGKLYRWASWLPNPFEANTLVLDDWFLQVPAKVYSYHVDFEKKETVTTQAARIVNNPSEASCPKPSLAQDIPDMTPYFRRQW